jgi:hypothetical protein
VLLAARTASSTASRARAVLFCGDVRRFHNLHKQQLCDFSHLIDVWAYQSRITFCYFSTPRKLVQKVNFCTR